ncbi:hypothetical protein MTX20_04455 [Bradyrhizobium sp. ISRA435]|nr:hypothetical protein MTX20_04455 [Bradyrhizobium sp. ISRA435]
MRRSHHRATSEARQVEQLQGLVVNFQYDHMAMHITGFASLSLPLPHLNSPAVTAGLIATSLAETGKGRPRAAFSCARRARLFLTVAWSLRRRI